MYFIFDTETTGLSSYQHRIVSICWKIYTENGDLFKSYYNIIKPDGFVIDNNSIAVQINGITQEIAMNNGVDINSIFNELNNDLDLVNLLVAHNLSFDKRFLIHELNRYKRHNVLAKFLNKETYCTKLKSSEYNNGRWMKLGNLYKLFFNEIDYNEHNAEGDVIACARCFFKIEKIII